jgi:Cobalamin synthesis protein cobW C-terminal domain
MNKSHIIAVAGAAGVGKTTWISQQLASGGSAVCYFCPQTGGTPIDSTHLAANFPQLVLLDDENISQLQQLSTNTTTYIEMGFHLSLATNESLVANLNVHKVAIVPPGSKHTEWHHWADTIEIGQVLPAAVPQDLWRSNLTSQVLDPASLDMLWYELTNGAYGTVQRAKGVYDLADGRSFYFDFVAGQEKKYQELNLPLWLEGRPDRFSGMEVIGINLDREAIGDTLRDCCLSNEAIAYYQAQTKQSLMESAS